MNWIITINGKKANIKLPDQLPHAGPLPVSIDGKHHEVTILNNGETLSITSEGNTTTTIELKHLDVAKTADSPTSDINMELRRSNCLERVEATAMLDAPGMESIQSRLQQSGATVKSPMAGKVLKVLEASGTVVSKGQAVAIIEAMKMENRIAAPANGKLVLAGITEGDQVTAGQKLFEIENQ